MANTLTEVIPKLLAQGLLALRQQAVMPRFVNRAYEVLAGEKGSTIDVPIPSAITAVAVSPSYIPPSSDGATVPTKVALSMDQWWEAPFYLSDKDVLEAMSGIIPMQASEAVKSIANKVDTTLLALYTGVYGFAGIAGFTPFATDLTEFLDADTVLNDQLAPIDPRTVLLNSRATGNAKGLRAIQDASWRNDPEAMRRSEIGFVLGYSWAMDQNIPRHVTGAAGTVIAVDNSGGYGVADVLGGGTVHMDGFTVKPATGDILTFAGHTQTYVVVSSSALAGTDSDVVVNPGLQAAIADDEVVTFKASHRVNLAFHRDAFALASRPFAGADPFALGHYMSAVDPVSGLTLRLEVSRQFKQTRFSYDILYGVKLIRPELVTRIAGE